MAQGLTLVLIGFMGSGKSSAGRKAAHLLGVEFVDLDARIRDVAQMPIPEFFKLRGETAFRALEHSQLKWALQEECVLATGGGAVINEWNRRLLAESGALVIYLRATPKTLSRRIRAQPGTRPLIDGEGELSLPETENRVRELLGIRERWYEECADATIETDALSSGETAEQIVAQIVSEAVREIEAFGREFGDETDDRNA